MSQFKVKSVFETILDLYEHKILIAATHYILILADAADKHRNVVLLEVTKICIHGHMDDYRH